MEGWVGGDSHLVSYGEKCLSTWRTALWLTHCSWLATNRFDKDREAKGISNSFFFLFHFFHFFSPPKLTLHLQLSQPCDDPCNQTKSRLRLALKMQC